jgi:flagellar protein FliO/FliZ
MKFISKKNNFFSGNRSFRSLGGIPLGPNKSVQVVEIGKSLYIVGVSETIQLLEKIDGADEVKSIKDMLLSPSSGSQGFQSFGGWLQSLRSSGKQAQEEEELDVSASFQQVFHSKLQNLSNRKKMVEDMLMEDKNLDRLNDK